ncbi:hypothetical protein N480_06790 [Pseudoalteromonas luteoviolacea S2607]|uniref:TonB-dependent receptor domain-containing protein n=1 Tax=Pseudoalteromonas luteoviolacea TaxID=43657 RepID=UPI0007B044EC|nr:TonB-dependent receptor [Pseudoalteromonas luteoviolacea]KZN29423.1 hypothetical protein N480_06790 [Pseudoalteromonas luteoviolacea S2607]
MRYSKLSQSIKTSLIAGSILTTGFSQLAVAEEAGAEGKVERIEVTGSRIKRIAMEGASPVTTVTAEDIKVAGITRVEDMLNDMPAVFAGQTSGTANGATGTATVDLRNLGPERTLVLLNGRRLPAGSPSAGGIGADLNQIPAALVKRVDVLTGGSSATYGSDAVAGVVNFILKDDFEGFQFEYQGSLYQHNNDHGDMQRAVNERGFALPESNVSDGQADDFTVIVGANSADGRGNVTAYASFREIEAITQDSRDYSACAMNINDEGVRQCGGSGTIPEGRIIAGDASLMMDGHTFKDYDGTLYNYGPLNYFQRPDKRKTFGLLGHYDLSDNHTFYTEMSYMDNRTVAQIAPSGSFFRPIDLACNNPLLSEQQVQKLCTDQGFGADHVFSGDNAALAVKRNVEGGPRQDDRRHTSTRFVFGVRGEINDYWTYDAYMNFGEVAYVQTYDNDLSIQRITRALDAVRDNDGNVVCKSVVDGSDPNCVPWNIFNRDQITQDQLDYLIVPLYSRGETKNKQISGFVSGDLTDYGVVVPGATTGVGIVLGLEHRREFISLRPDQNFLSGDGAGQGGPTTGVTGEYDVDEFFMELNVPVIEDTSYVDYVTLELGYRYSDYSTDKQTDTYKFAVDTRVSEDFGFRASYQRAVRAGNVRELFRPAGMNLFNWDEDPCGPGKTLTLAECQRTGLPAGQYGAAILDNPAGQYNTIEGGNPALEPEESDTVSFGLLYSPSFVEGLDITLDYFDITVEKAIQSIPAATIHDKCAKGVDELCDLINRGSGRGDLWIGTSAITATDTNIGSVKTSGIDINTTYNYSLNDMGNLRFALIGTYLEKYEIENIPGDRPDDCAGYWDRAVCEVPAPKVRANLVTTWSTPWDTNITATVRHYGKVDEYTVVNNTVVNGPTTLNGKTYFDLAATWNATDHLTFRAGIKNLFDVTPPLVPNGPSGDANGNTYPGQYDALGRYLFAGFTFTM